MFDIITQIHRKIKERAAKERKLPKKKRDEHERKSSKSPNEPKHDKETTTKMLLVVKNFYTGYDMTTLHRTVLLSKGVRRVRSNPSIFEEGSGTRQFLRGKQRYFNIPLGF